MRDAASLGRTISIAGSSTKRRMAGPIEDADVPITTMSLRGVLQYEPRDLTVSVLAGLGWSEFTALLARNRQMVPLDPAFDSGDGGRRDRALRAPVGPGQGALHCEPGHATRHRRMLHGPEYAETQ